MAAFPESQDSLNTPTAPSPLPGVHEHAGPSFLFPTKGSNNLAHASSVFPKHVPLHLLQQITNDFSEDRLLGVGTYGKVYKGVHENGETVAVKLLHPNPGFDDAQFEMEFRNLISLHHKNIVRLVGFCHETRREFVLYNAKMIFADSTRMALCFEYMHKGSLANYLFDEYSGPDWPTRYGIIKGICQGLKYLHEELNPPILHLDLKPANILLDDHMMPKLADFGLSRIGQELTRITESRIGTIGYLPPEYIEWGIISNKFDIFGLGVIIIKMITGSAGYTQCAEMPSNQFIELVCEKWRNRLQATSEEAIEAYSQQLMGCIEMALRCVDKERHNRPSIGEIIDKLNEMDTKDQGSSDQGLSVEKCSTPAQASLLPASSYTPQETTNTKGVSRPIEHSRSVTTGLMVSLSRSVVDEALKNLSAIEEVANQRQRAQSDLVFIVVEIGILHSFLRAADGEKGDENVMVLTYMRQIRELVFEVEACIDITMHLDKCKMLISSNWWFSTNRWTFMKTKAPFLPLDMAVNDLEQPNARYSLISDSGSKLVILAAQQQPAPHAAAGYVTKMQQHAFLRELGNGGRVHLWHAQPQPQRHSPRRLPARLLLGPCPTSGVATSPSTVCRTASSVATASPLPAAHCSMPRYGSPVEGFALLLRPDATQPRVLMRGAGACASVYARPRAASP